MKNELANRYISILYRYGRRFLARQIEAHALEIEAGQLPFLMQAFRFPGISQDAASANLGMDKGTTARSMKQLEALGYVRRVPGSTDRRINEIYPTEKALAIQPRIFEIITALDQIFYAGFAPNEIEAANRMLLRMKGNMEAEMRKGES